jgi:peptidoglycan/LPS O-acetylase OafA/YrhL
MFYTLLAVTFVISFIVSAVIVRIFEKPSQKIFQRIIQDDIASAWTTYLKFALYVVGISSGIRLHQLERYIIKPPYGKDPQIETLTTEKWVLELYRTIIETLQGLAWVLLIFFIISLVAFVVIRFVEVIKKNKEQNG